jgi:hypothetical protein
MRIDAQFMLFCRNRRQWWTELRVLTQQSANE